MCIKCCDDDIDWRKRAIFSSKRCVYVSLTDWSHRRRHEFALVIFKNDCLLIIIWYNICVQPSLSSNTGVARHDMALFVLWLITLQLWIRSSSRYCTDGHGNNTTTTKKIPVQGKAQVAGPAASCGLIVYIITCRRACTRWQLTGADSLTRPTLFHYLKYHILSNPIPPQNGDQNLISWFLMHVKELTQAPRGLSAEDKRVKLLEIFHESVNLQSQIVVYAYSISEEPSRKTFSNWKN